MRSVYSRVYLLSFGFFFAFRWLECIQLTSLCILVVTVDHLFYMYPRVHVNSKLLIYLAYSWRLGSLQGARGTPGPFCRYTACYMLPAPSVSGLSRPGTQGNEAPGMWHQSMSLWPEGNRHFLSMFLSCNLTCIILVNYFLVGPLFFLFQSNATWSTSP